MTHHNYHQQRAQEVQLHHLPQQQQDHLSQDPEPRNETPQGKDAVTLDADAIALDIMGLFNEQGGNEQQQQQPRRGEQQQQEQHDNLQ